MEPILVFANKIKTVEFVADLIAKHKCSVVALHSKLPQVCSTRTRSFTPLSHHHVYTVNDHAHAFNCIHVHVDDQFW